MADDTPPPSVLAQYYGDPKTGSWGDEPAPQGPGIGRQFADYLRSLGPRAMMHFAEEGRRLRDDSVKENARRTFGVGPIVDAVDAGREGRYPAMVGNAALGALDLSAGVGSPATATADALAHAWHLASRLRPDEVKAALAAMTTKRMKATGPAAEKRAAAAERSVPQPALPPGARYPSEAEHMLDVINGARLPGNLMAGAGTAAGATGVPGVMLDDAKGAAESYIDPVIGQYRTMQQEMGREREQNAVPLRGDAAARPNIAYYQNQQDEAKHRRNINVADAVGEGIGGVGATYGAMKTVPWAWSRGMPGLIALGAEAASIHPMLGLPIMAAGALPYAVPAALGYGSWAAAHDMPDKASAALDAHAKAKLIAKLIANYRDPQMKLTPDGDY